MGQAPGRERRTGRGGQDAGSAALLVILGGSFMMLLALVLVVTVADLVTARGRAQTAADAAALAAMEGVLAGEDGEDGAAVLADANGARLLSCCGDDPWRPVVEVGVAPRSTLVRSVVPNVRATAAATVEAAGVPGSDVADGALSAGSASTGAGAAAGGRAWPVAGRISSGFGTRTHPLTGQRRLHAGLDIAAPAGTPIRAAAAGRVASAGPRGGYGLTVDVVHGDGTVTRYAHQSQLLVARDQAVAAGQVIGRVGSTGNSTGPHLHFEVRTAAGPIDPRTWLPQ